MTHTRSIFLYHLLNFICPLTLRLLFVISQVLHLKMSSTLDLSRILATSFTSLMMLPLALLTYYTTQHLHIGVSLYLITFITLLVLISTVTVASVISGLMVILSLCLYKGLDFCTIINVAFLVCVLVTLFQHAYFGTFMLVVSCAIINLSVIGVPAPGSFIASSFSTALFPIFFGSVMSNNRHTLNYLIVSMYLMRSSSALFTEPTVLCYHSASSSVGFNPVDPYSSSLIHGLDSYYTSTLCTDYVYLSAIVTDRFELGTSSPQFELCYDDSGYEFNCAYQKFTSLSLSHPYPSTYLSVGESHASSLLILPILRDHKSRSLLVDSILQNVLRYGFSGVHLSINDSSYHYVDDSIYLAQFLFDLHSVFVPFGFKIAFLATGDPLIASRYYHNDIYNYLDLIPIVTFNYYTGFESTVNHPSPLCGPSSVYNTVSYYLSLGIPLSNFVGLLSSDHLCYQLSNSSVVSTTGVPATFDNFCLDGCSSSILVNEPFSICPGGIWCGYDDLSSSSAKTSFYYSVGLGGFGLYLFDNSYCSVESNLTLSSCYLSWYSPHTFPTCQESSVGLDGSVYYATYSTSFGSSPTSSNVLISQYSNLYRVGEITPISSWVVDGYYYYKIDDYSYTIGPDDTPLDYYMSGCICYFDNGYLQMFCSLLAESPLYAYYNDSTHDYHYEFFKYPYVGPNSHLTSSGCMNSGSGWYCCGKEYNTTHFPSGTSDLGDSSLILGVYPTAIKVVPGTYVCSLTCTNSTSYIDGVDLSIIVVDRKRPPDLYSTFPITFDGDLSFVSTVNLTVGCDYRLSLFSCCFGHNFTFYSSVQFCFHDIVYSSDAVEPPWVCYSNATDLWPSTEDWSSAVACSNTPLVTTSSTTTIPSTVSSTVITIPSIGVTSTNSATSFTTPLLTTFLSSVIISTLSTTLSTLTSTIPSTSTAVATTSSTSTTTPSTTVTSSSTSTTTPSTTVTTLSTTSSTGALSTTSSTSVVPSTSKTTTATTSIITTSVSTTPSTTTTFTTTQATTKGTSTSTTTSGSERLCCELSSSFLLASLLLYYRAHSLVLVPLCAFSFLCLGPKSLIPCEPYGPIDDYIPHYYTAFKDNDGTYLLTTYHSILRICDGDLVINHVDGYDYLYYYSPDTYYVIGDLLGGFFPLEIFTYSANFTSTRSGFSVIAEFDGAGPGWLSYYSNGRFITLGIHSNSLYSYSTLTLCVNDYRGWYCYGDYSTTGAPDPIISSTSLEPTTSTTTSTVEPTTTSTTSTVDPTTTTTSTVEPTTTSTTTSTVKPTTTTTSTVEPTTTSTTTSTVKPTTTTSTTTTSFATITSTSTSTTSDSTDLCCSQVGEPLIPCEPYQPSYNYTLHYYTIFYDTNGLNWLVSPHSILRTCDGDFVSTQVDGDDYLFSYDPSNYYVIGDLIGGYFSLDTFTYSAEFTISGSIISVSAVFDGYGYGIVSHFGPGYFIYASISSFTTFTYNTSTLCVNDYRGWFCHGDYATSGTPDPFRVATTTATTTTSTTTSTVKPTTTTSTTTSTVKPTSTTTSTVKPTSTTTSTVKPTTTTSTVKPTTTTSTANPTTTTSITTSTVKLSTSTTTSTVKPTITIKPTTTSITTSTAKPITSVSTTALPTYTLGIGSASFKHLHIYAVFTFLLALLLI